MNRPDHDTPRDAHLLAALRHAPDRDEAPPAEVTARILRAARAAVAPTPASSWRQRLAAWWRWPQASAAFGTLAVAVLVGVMWSTREPPADLPSELRREALPPPAVAAAPVVVEALPPTASQPAPDRAASTEAPRAPRKPAAESRPTARTPSAAAKAQAPDNVPDTLPDPAREASADARAESPPAVPTPAAAPRQEAATAASGELAQRARRDAASPSAPASALAGRLAGSAQNSVAVDPLARIEPLLREPGARWLPSSATNGSAQQAWWASVVDATRGRWTRPTHPAVPVAPWLTLAVDGQTRAVFWLHDDGLALQIGNEVWHAAVPLPLRRDWQEAVSRW